MQRQNYQQEMHQLQTKRKRTNVELSRHKIREKAVQALFSKELNESFSDKDAIMFVLTYDGNDISQIQNKDFDYLTILVHGVTNKRNQIDALIERHLRNWTIQRLPRLDLTIMRVAVYEMMVNDDIPNVAVINEAIQIAKTFSDDKSRRFINAVLANINNDLQEA